MTKRLGTLFAGLILMASVGLSIGPTIQPRPCGVIGPTRCVPPPPGACGAVGQRPCPPTCGAFGQRPCGIIGK
jgi:hypothetical protein